MRLLGLVLVAAIILSGCTSKGGPGPATVTSTEVPVAQPAQFDETSGAIDGLVYDTEYVPLSGVLLSIPDLELETVSDAEGRFTFSLLPPGVYDLFAQLIGYDSMARSVTIAAGEATHVEMSLAAIAITEPYPETFIKKGLLGCAVIVEPGSGLSACGAAGIVTILTGVDTSSVDNFRLVWDVQRNVSTWHTTIHEMQWRSTQAFGGGLWMLWEVNLCSGDPKNTFGSAEGKSPLRVRADFEKVQSIVPAAKSCNQQNAGLVVSDMSQECNPSKCRLQSRVFQTAETTQQAVDVGVGLMQSFEQFFTVFFHGPAPESFTALPDA